MTFPRIIVAFCLAVAFVLAMNEESTTKEIGCRAFDTEMTKIREAQEIFTKESTTKEIGCRAFDVELKKTREAQEIFAEITDVKLSIAKSDDELNDLADNEAQNVSPNRNLKIREMAMQSLPTKRLVKLSLANGLAWLVVEICILVAHFLIPAWKFWFPWLQILNVMNPLILAGLVAFEFLLKKSFQLKIYWFSGITAILGILIYHSAMANLKFSNHQPFYYHLLVHLAPWFLVLCSAWLYHCCDECRPYLARDTNKI